MGGKTLCAVHANGSIFSTVLVVGVDAYLSVDKVHLLGNNHLDVVPLEVVKFKWRS